VVVVTVTPRFRAAKSLQLESPKDQAQIWVPVTPPTMMLEAGTVVYEGKSG
jgi:hypothetical protein